VVAFAGVAVELMSESINYEGKKMGYCVLPAAADRRSSDSRRAPVMSPERSFLDEC
jgi:hypothetical protein